MLLLLDVHFPILEIFALCGFRIATTRERQQAQTQNRHGEFHTSHGFFSEQLSASSQDTAIAWPDRVSSMNEHGVAEFGVISPIVTAVAREKDPPQRDFCLDLAPAARGESGDGIRPALHPRGLLSTRLTRICTALAFCRPYSGPGRANPAQKKLATSRRFLPDITPRLRSGCSERRRPSTRSGTTLSLSKGRRSSKPGAAAGRGLRGSRRDGTVSKSMRTETIEVRAEDFLILALCYILLPTFSQPRLHSIQPRLTRH